MFYEKKSNVTVAEIARLDGEYANMISKDDHKLTAEEKKDKFKLKLQKAARKVMSNNKGERLPLVTPSPSDAKKLAKQQLPKTDTPLAPLKDRPESVRSASMHSYLQSLLALGSEAEPWAVEEERAASVSARVGVGIAQPSSTAELATGTFLSARAAPKQAPNTIPDAPPLASSHAASAAAAALRAHGSSSETTLTPEQVPVTPSARVTRKQPSIVSMPAEQPQLSLATTADLDVPQLEDNAQEPGDEGPAIADREEAAPQMSVHTQADDNDGIPPEFR